MPRHIEQPAERHSAPAAVKILSRPSCLGLEPHAHRAGHDQHPHAVGDLAAVEDLGDRRAGPRSGRWCTSRRRRCRRGCRAAACRPEGPCRSSAFSAATRSFSSTIALRVRHPLAERQALARVGAPGDERGQRVGVDVHLGVEHRVVVGAQLAPRGDGGVPVGALRRVVAAAQVVEGRLVRRDHAGAGARLDRHVADRHPGLHREVLDDVAAVLQHVALAAAGADLGDDREDRRPCS